MSNELIYCALGVSAGPTGFGELPRLDAEQARSLLSNPSQHLQQSVLLYSFPAVKQQSQPATCLQRMLQPMI